MENPPSSLHTVGFFKLFLLLLFVLKIGHRSYIKGANCWGCVRVSATCSLMPCAQKIQLVWYTSSFSPPPHICVSLCLSLSNTHTHTHTPLDSIISQLATQSSSLYMLVLLFDCLKYRLNMEAAGENVLNPSSAVEITSF